MWHAHRGRLLLRTPGPVPLGLAYVLLVETNPFPNLSLYYRTMLFGYPSVLSRFCFLHLPPICIDNWAGNFIFDFGFFNSFSFRKVLYKNNPLKYLWRAYYAPFAVLRYILRYFDTQWLSLTVFINHFAQWHVNQITLKFWVHRNTKFERQNRNTKGCSKLKRSVDMTSSGKNGLNIRTNASPKWDRTRCPEELASFVG